MPSKVRCRQIADIDVAGIVDLLTNGFHRRSRQYWQQALERLAKHPTPEGLPKYGYLLEADDRIVGVILLIFKTTEYGNERITWCNVSSWYLDPAFRSFATMLTSQAFKRKDVTFLNISPAANVQPIIEAQGFQQYCRGQFVAIPILSRAPTDIQARVLGAEERPDTPFESFERDLLLSHAAFGCIGLWCVTAQRSYPFVFASRLIKGLIPCAQLIYCRQVEDFVQFARPIGSFLFMRGKPLALVDSNGPIPALVGFYFDGVSPKYFKGPHRPRLGDLSYTEAAIFGV